MAAIDEAPSLREGGPIFTFREAGAEYRSGGGRERGCLTCGAVVADAEHRTICELVGITPVMHGPVAARVASVSNGRPTAGRTGLLPRRRSGATFPATDRAQGGRQAR
jgi:hypothetical protein